MFCVYRRKDSKFDQKGLELKVWFCSALGERIKPSKCSRCPFRKKGVLDENEISNDAPVQSDSASEYSEECF